MGEHPELDKSLRVEQQVDPLPCGELLLRVLRGDALFAAHLHCAAAASIKFIGELVEPGSCLFLGQRSAALEVRFALLEKCLHAFAKILAEADHGELRVQVMQRSLDV